MPNSSPQDKALHYLQNTFGYPEFRLQQGEIINTLINADDALVLMPTGGGKSLCYQIPSLVRNGTGIIISPLIALMHDQVMALQQLPGNLYESFQRHAMIFLCFTTREINYL